MKVGLRRCHRSSGGASTRTPTVGCKSIDGMDAPSSFHLVPTSSLPHSYPLGCTLLPGSSLPHTPFLPFGMYPPPGVFSICVPL